MYITVTKGFFKEGSVEYACAIDVNKDIVVHKTFEQALEYHKRMLDECKNNYAGFITNDAQFISEKKNKEIATVVEYTTGNGNNYKTVYQTTYKNYED